MKERKIIEWLNLIEDSEIRSNAIENCTDGEKVVGDIKEAIISAFDWMSSPQRVWYWVRVYRSDIKLIDSI